MKTFKQFISETPSMSGPVVPDNPAMAGYVPKLFPHDTTPLDQGFQGPGETGQDRYNRFFGVIPTERMTLKTKLDGNDSIDQMVQASKEFVALQDSRSAAIRYKQFRQNLIGDK